MNPFTLGLMAVLTIFAWITVGYCIHASWQSRKRLKRSVIVGHVTKVTSDDHGVYIDGKLNDAFRIPKQRAFATDAISMMSNPDAEDNLVVDYIGTQPKNT